MTRNNIQRRQWMAAVDDCDEKIANNPDPKVVEEAKARKANLERLLSAEEAS